MAIARLAFQSTLPIQGETSVTAKSFSGIGFQSTLPIQGETPFRPKWIQARRNFNPLSLYRERQGAVGKRAGYNNISIHSPYTGRDRG